jgi:hypothetical protein
MQDHFTKGAAATFGIEEAHVTKDQRRLFKEAYMHCLVDRAAEPELVEDRAPQLYEAYAEKAGWKSVITGAPLPPWEDVPPAVRECWLAAAGVP